MRSNGDIARILARDHPEPHSFLGAHPTDEGVVFRCFKPGAEWVRVLPEGHDPFQLKRIHKDGVFAGTLEGAREPPAYELELSFPGWQVVVEHDPYSFLPTVGELDLHLTAEGRQEQLQRVLGAHVREIDGVSGVAFAVWAPSARSVSVVGDFNSWDGRLHPMRSLGGSGIWELFVPELHEGAVYKYELRTREGQLRLKADPLAARGEEPPRTGSVVFRPRHAWSGGDWLDHRAGSQPWSEPMSVYEVHLGSWRWNPLEGNRPLTYVELGEELADYANDMGFTHVELLPVMEHPFGGSWGYQVTGFFAPTARYGSPDDFRTFVDCLHSRGVGVILDWVPAHFPRDEFALARFDGTALYEHADPRKGSHPDWGTLIFNYGRTEVKNFLLSSALTWLEDFHADGLRVDAVASMLYLDYSRDAGEWLPNVHGGRENLEAVAFLRELNAVSHRRVPGVVMAAEESTAWPSVTRPTDAGGLGFGFKWNMGWMHDTLQYFARDPIYRSHHQNDLTFSMVYAFTENFVLPLSHDEVVHGKGSLLSKMPGDRWQKLANLRALYAYMWAHPGKQLLFMGGELAQEREWSHDSSIDWHLRDVPEHVGVQALVRDLNRAYRAEPALWELDFEPAGFRWLEASDAAANVIAFVRQSRGGERLLVCACNLSPVPREEYRLGLPRAGVWQEVINTDDGRYGGSGMSNGRVTAEETPWHGQPYSAPVTLPPLGVVWLAPEGR